MYEQPRLEAEPTRILTIRKKWRVTGEVMLNALLVAASCRGWRADPVLAGMPDVKNRHLLQLTMPRPSTGCPRAARELRGANGTAAAGSYTGSARCVLHFWHYRTPLSSLVGERLLAHKPLHQRLLQRVGVRVPSVLPLPRSVDTMEWAAFDAWLERNGAHVRFPAVLKPEEGSGGSGVVVGVPSAAALYDLVARRTLGEGGGRYSHGLIEQMVHGRHYRIVAIDGEVVDIVQRLRPRVVGDGLHTVAQLAALSDRRRRATQQSTIVIDRAFLLAQGVNASSHIPSRGESVDVNDKVANRLGGGMWFVPRSHWPPDVRELVARVMSTLPQAQRIIGIDFISPNISLPVRHGWVNEVNNQPALKPHFHALGRPHGTCPLDVSNAVLDALVGPRPRPKLKRAAAL